MDSNMDYLRVAVESAVTFFVLLILTRLLGKKQLSQFTFFDYITGITIGSIAGAMIVLDTQSYLKEVTGLVVWCALSLGISLIGLKSGKVRAVLDGQPTIVIKEGMIDKKALAATKLNIDDLTMMARQQGVFSVAEIDYAILEPSGALSILKKPAYIEVQKGDMQINAPSPKHLPTEIISDGKLLLRNLAEVGVSEAWVSSELAKQGINKVSQVFYAEVNGNGTLYVQRQTDQ